MATSASNEEPTYWLRDRQMSPPYEVPLDRLATDLRSKHEQRSRSTKWFEQPNLELPFAATILALLLLPVLILSVISGPEPFQPNTSPIHFHQIHHYLNKLGHSNKILQTQVYSARDGQELTYRQYISPEWRRFSEWKDTGVSSVREEIEPLNPLHPHIHKLNREDDPIPTPIIGAEKELVVGIMLHDLGGDSLWFNYIAEYLTKTNVFHMMYSLDLRGHGEHTNAHGDTSYVGQYIDDIEDFMKQKVDPFLTSRAGRVYIVGHGGGAHLASYLLSSKYKHSKQFHGGILLSPIYEYTHHDFRPASHLYYHLASGRYYMNNFLNIFGIHLFNHLPIMNVNIPNQFNLSLPLSVAIPPTVTYTYAGLMNSGLPSGEILLKHIHPSKFVLSTLSDANEIISPFSIHRLIEESCKHCDVRVLSHDNKIGHMDMLLNKQIIHWMQEFVTSHVPIMMPANSHAHA